MKKTSIIVAVVLAISFFCAGMFAVAVLQELQRKPDAPAPVVPVFADTEDLWRLANDERMKAGLPALDRSPALDESAMVKCADMQAKNYWAHNDPSGASKYYDFIRTQIKYRQAGENLAQNTGDAAHTVQAWMNSPEHRKNMVDDKYTLVGYAVCNGSVGIVVVQHFVAR